MRQTRVVYSSWCDLVYIKLSNEKSFRRLLASFNPAVDDEVFLPFAVLLLLLLLAGDELFVGNADAKFGSKLEPEFELLVVIWPENPNDDPDDTSWGCITIWCGDDVKDDPPAPDGNPGAETDDVMSPGGEKGPDEPETDGKGPGIIWGGLWPIPTPPGGAIP